VEGANPIVAGIGLTDPHIVIYSDRAWMYATHDFSAKLHGFFMKDWWVWSSDDLVHWQEEGRLRPEETFLHKPFNQCWATFGISKNGKYYWYFSAGPEQIGVVVGDTPKGPWKDPLGKPLIPKGMLPTQARDPDLMIDDDGHAYMVFGTFNYFIVRLNDDMISLAETPRPVVLDRRFGPYGEGKTDDKPSLHKRHGIYYLSWSSFYAVSKNVYGPYTYRGSVIDESQMAPPLRKGNVHLDRHGNFFTWHNQWFYGCNDQSLPGCDHYFRDSLLSYVHYRDDGDIAPVRMDLVGVGQYDAAARIEAEDFFAMTGGEVRECPAGGFEVRGLRADSTLNYPNVFNLPANATCQFRLSAAGQAGGSIEIREGSGNGALLGTCAISATGGWDQYQTVSTTLRNAAGQSSIWLTFTGPAGELVRLDWLSFGS
jgi:hypothetical protein